MKVLGISPLDKDATVSIVEDGRVLFAAGEERFSRVKQQDGFPSLALEQAFAHTGLKASDVDLVTYPFLTWENEKKLFERNLESERAFMDEFRVETTPADWRRAEAAVPHRTDAIHGLDDPNAKMAKGPLYDLFYRIAGSGKGASRFAARRQSRIWADGATESFQRFESELAAGLTRHGLGDKPRRMDHHLSHAANSFLTSGFERALVITLDGYGSGLAGSVSEGVDGKIHRLHSIDYPNSLGTLYEHVTSSLGFRPGRHEGKIVGLASYGDPSILAPLLLGRIEQTPGAFRIFQSNNIYFARDLAGRFPKIDVAAAYQHVLEVVATNYVRHWVEKTGINRVVLSGGVTANVKLNQRIFEIDGVEEIFVYPNMGDGGCGTGAALYHSWPGGHLEPISDVYWGPEYGDAEMRAALDAAGLAYTRPEHLARDVAAQIDGGAVVGRFDGRMEYGPRALGNRSVLYHAREPEVNQWLNKRLRRTEFMPFAPVTIYEARERYYHNIRGAEHAAQFMTITFDCTEEMRRNCPAAVHVDGTARPQLVRREVNPGYYDILDEYGKLTGTPTLINTSFNMHEEPIVASPADAVKAFLDGGLDVLVLGPYLANHPTRKPAGAQGE